MFDSGLARYVAGAVCAIAGYFLLPAAVQNLALVASNVTAAVVVLHGVRSGRLRPVPVWALMAAFPIATGVGNAVYFVNDSIRHVSPFPSVGDAAFLGGYVLLAAALLRLRRARPAGRDVAALLDAGIITIGFAATAWVLFMAPLVHGRGTPVLDRLVALGYPVADVLVLAVAARFLFTTRRRSPAYGWLAGTVVVMLLGDTGFAVLTLLGTYSTGHPVDALLLAYNLGWGAVALHPRAGDLAAAGPERTGRPGWPRLAVLCAASMVAPVVLVVQVATGHLEDVVVTSAAAAALFLLVVLRMAGLVVQLEGVLEQRQELQHELAHRATHDDLTGLANRRAFTDRLGQALHEQPAGGSTVLFLDLDGFKTVNDSLGHAAGDALLAVVADRLRAELRADDLAARFGGDEFAVLLTDPVPAGAALTATVTRLADTVRRPVHLHGLDVQVGVSIGSAVAQPGDEVERLLHTADHAMYAAKAGSPVRRSAALARGQADGTVRQARRS